MKYNTTMITLHLNGGDQTIQFTHYGDHVMGVAIGDSKFRFEFDDVDEPIVFDNRLEERLAKGQLGWIGVSMTCQLAQRVMRALDATEHPRTVSESYVVYRRKHKRPKQLDTVPFVYTE